LLPWLSVPEGNIALAIGLDKRTCCEDTFARIRAGRSLCRGLPGGGAMAKGLRMFRARNTAGGHLLTISQIRTRQSLICADCGTPIVYNRAHQRGDSTQVAAYLRLAQGRDHGPDCKYNLRSQVEALAALGRSLDEAAQPLRLLADGKYLLRLGIPGDGPTASQRTDETASTTDGKSIRQVWSGRTLAPYCRTASGLARIAALVEHKPELESMVLIRHGDRRIDWNDFFFEKEEGARLVGLL
jgi:hypothetical protein